MTSEEIISEIKNLLLGLGYPVSGVERTGKDERKGREREYAKSRLRWFRRTFKHDPDVSDLLMGLDLDVPGYDFGRMCKGVLKCSKTAAKDAKAAQRAREGRLT